MNRRKKNPKGIDASAVQVPRATRWRRVVRIASAASVVGLLAVGLSLGALYFLTRGNAVENAALNSRVEASIQRLIGPDFELDIGTTAVGFDRDGFLSLSSSDVSVRRTADGQLISNLGRVIAGVRPLSVLTGQPQIDALIIEDSSLDGRLLLQTLKLTPPRTLEEGVSVLRRRLRLANAQFERANFRLFQFRDVNLTGARLGRLGQDDIRLERFELRRRANGQLEVDAGVRTDASDISIAGEYRAPGASGESLELSIADLNLREWANDPELEIGGFGSDALVSIDLNVPFADPDADPSITATVSGSRLRVGRKAVTTMQELELDFSLLLDKNQIELNPSQLRAGDFSTLLTGGVKPADEEIGYKGDLLFELIANDARSSPTVVGEGQVTAAMRLGGEIKPSARVIDIQNFLVRADNDSLIGSGSIGFHGATPSFAAALKSQGLDVAAVKQLWPFFIAPPARKWVREHVVGGRVAEIALDAAVPSGIFGKIRQGAKLDPDEFDLRASFSGVRMDTFGELPPIRDGAGKLSIVGMSVDVNVSSGVVYVADAEPAEIVEGSFVIPDFGVRPNPTQVRVSMEGATRSLGAISNSKPLIVFDRMDLDPYALDGTANIDVAANFLLKKGLREDEVEWHAIADLTDTGSSQKLFERNIRNADLHLEATSRSVRVTGEAEVDGTRTRLELVEPIGGSDVKSERSYSASLDEAARKKMGLALDAVIKGTIGASVEELGGGRQSQDLDLTNAELLLPWIGWTKGKGVPATATFVMSKGPQGTRLDDFYLEGDGFSAAGELIVDSKGVVSADFSDIALNESDSFTLKIGRQGNIYKIDVAGLRMDARGLINKLFHEGDFGDEAGTTNIELTADLGLVRGFNGRAVRNVAMTYGTKEGRFDRLSLRGLFTDNTYVNILANTSSQRTTFEVDSNDAGATVGFIDVYRRMIGGELRARLVRDQDGVFKGPIQAANFVISDEPRLGNVVSGGTVRQQDRGEDISKIKRELSKVNTKQVRFLDARAQIEKGTDSLQVKDGVLTSVQFGLTFDGTLFDEKSNMNLSGTFLPAVGISRAIGFIPLVGELLGNGRDTGLLGITFRMSGPSKDPKLEINPISLVTPGIFRKVFEFPG